MLQITIDAFSGRQNPSSIMDGQEANDLLTEISRNRNAVAALDSGYQGLGLRGVIVETLDDTLPERFGLPHAFRLAGGASANEAKAQELAERLIKQVLTSGVSSQFALAQTFEATMLGMLAAMPALNIETVHDASGAPVVGTAQPVTCLIELGAFNPGFWNDPNYIARNNCYNYASNRRTNTFAQPGRGSGHQYTALTCQAVTAAALSDGLHHRFDCFPDSEKPRWLVAMVVAPGYDYHWYRKHKEGFWGHKPGGTAARNVDNNNRVIGDPQTCSRAPYTDFCGYFYVPRSQRIQ